MMKLLKNPLFLIGFLFITGLLIISFVYSEVMNNEVKQIQLLFDDNGKVVASSPISPRWSIPFGTDELGFNMLSKVIIGAKYTILAAFVIAALRIVISLLLGFLVGIYFPKVNRFLMSVIDGFHFVPLSLIALYLLTPVLVSGPEGFQYSLTERIIIEIIVLTALTVPILTTFIANETVEVLKKEFVVSAKLLGGSKLHIIKNHIIPVLRDRLLILYGQQITQTLLCMIHLGLFNLYFGGTVITYGDVADPPKSVLNEWSGLIGGTKNFIGWAPWIPLTPIICFALTIIAIKFMIEGYMKVNEGNIHSRKWNKGKMFNSLKNEHTLQGSPFEFVRRKRTG